MSQSEKASHFLQLHQKGNPLVLYNIWDAGSAKAVEKAGAKALATGSWSVADAQGYPDGEAIPLEQLEQTAGQICNATDLPVSIDFEGAYSADPAEAAANASRIVKAGAVGINFEDQIVGGEGLHETEHQQSRIAAIHAVGSDLNIPIVINARTDLFLKAGDASEHSALLEQAIFRAKAYHTAGASCFFAPGLVDETLIGELCAASPLPVNIIMFPGAPTVARQAELGVARVSYGPGPYRKLMAALEDAAAGIYGQA